MTTRLLFGTLLLFASQLVSVASADDAKPADPEAANTSTDPDLAADLQLLQGSWELLHGNEGKGPPNTRSIKTVVGNKETLSRYNVMSGKKVHEHSVEFQLSKSGSIRVMTFFSPGAPKSSGLSFIYKVNKEYFWDIPGMLHGKEYRNYQEDPTIWRWRRMKPDEVVPTPAAEATDPAKATPR